jgi:hypothetical protein
VQNTPLRCPTRTFVATFTVPGRPGAHTCAHLRSACAVGPRIAHALRSALTRTYEATCAHMRDVPRFLRTRVRARAHTRPRVAPKIKSRLRAGSRMRACAKSYPPQTRCQRQHPHIKRSGHIDQRRHKYPVMEFRPAAQPLPHHVRRGFARVGPRRVVAAIPAPQPPAPQAAPRYECAGATVAVKLGNMRRYPPQFL